MKKEIMKLVSSEEGIFVINNISYLRRWTTSAINEKVDKLVIDFKRINNVYFAFYEIEITARDFDGIIKEITAATQEYLQLVSNELCRNLKNGYRNCKHL